MAFAALGAAEMISVMQQGLRLAPAS